MALWLRVACAGRLKALKLSPGVGLNCGVLLLNSTLRTLENLQDDRGGIKRRLGSLYMMHLMSGICEF